MMSHIKSTKYRITFLVVSIIFASTANAHTAPTHEHAEIVPIPSYSQTFGVASGNASFEAAQALLAELTKDQQQDMIFDLHAKERTLWSNLPTGRSPREGLSIGEMSEAQRVLLFDFLSASLGEQGYQRMAEVLAAEAYLATTSRSGRMGWVPENYWLAFFNQPSKEGEWGWHFGGHHLGINISIENGKVESLSPTLVGSEPVVFELNGIEYSVLTDMYTAGLDFYNTLSDEQKSKAEGVSIPREVVTGPGQDGVIPKRVGILGADLSEQQKEQLLSVIKMWLELQPEENANKRLLEIRSQFDEIAFAWSGSSDIVAEGYFRIQGPSVVIEHLSFGSRRRVGSTANGHYHTMYRNPINDYGK